MRDFDSLPRDRNKDGALVAAVRDGQWADTSPTRLRVTAAKRQPKRSWMLREVRSPAVASAEARE